LGGGWLKKTKKSFFSPKKKREKKKPKKKMVGYNSFVLQFEESLKDFQIEKLMEKHI